MTLFITETKRGVWISHHCERCHHPDTAQRRRDGLLPAEADDAPMCPILAKALRTDRKPPEWDRAHKPQTIAGTYKCNEFCDRPALARRKREQQFEDVPLFDVTPYATDHPGYVPVEGWPDRPGTKKEVDHQ